MCPRTVFLVIVSHVDAGASYVGNIIAVGTASAIPLALSLRSQLLQLLNSMVEDSRLQQFPAIAHYISLARSPYALGCVRGRRCVRGKGVCGAVAVVWRGGVGTH
jgi:hypothetical protein